VSIPKRSRQICQQRLWPRIAHQLQESDFLRDHIFAKEAGWRGLFGDSGGVSLEIRTRWRSGADSNPRDPSGFEGRNSTRVWRTIRPEQKDPRRRLSESAVALLEMWDGKSCRQEILRSMR